MTGTIPTVTVDTQAQSLILTELQNAHRRLFSLLEKIEQEARESREYANLDTTFLTGKTAELPKVIGTYEAFRDAAKWAGCDKGTIATVCQTDWVLIEVRAEEAAGRPERAEKKETDK